MTPKRKGDVPAAPRGIAGALTSATRASTRGMRARATGVFITRLLLGTLRPDSGRGTRLLLFPFGHGSPAVDVVERRSLTGEETSSLYYNDSERQREISAVSGRRPRRLGGPLLGEDGADEVPVGEDCRGEFADASCGLVSRRRVEYPDSPEHVVGEEEAAGRQPVLDDRQGGRVARLLDVVEDDVERALGPPEFVHRLVDAEADQVIHPQAAEIPAGVL